MQLRLTIHERIRQELQIYPGRQQVWRGSGYKNQAVSGKITWNPVFHVKRESGRNFSSVLMTTGLQGNWYINHTVSEWFLEELCVSPVFN